jgi:hypothetical protein
MSESVDRLMLQFLDWVAARPRTYAKAMGAWRTTCPRLSVWEDALIAGLVRVEGEGAGARVVVTAQGAGLLKEGAAVARRGVDARPEDAGGAGAVMP